MMMMMMMMMMIIIIIIIIIVVIPLSQVVSCALCFSLETVVHPITEASNFRL